MFDKYTIETLGLSPSLTILCCRPGKESSWTEVTKNKFKLTTANAKAAKTTVKSMKKGAAVSVTKLITTAVTKKATAITSGRPMAKYTSNDVGSSDGVTESLKTNTGEREMTKTVYTRAVSGIILETSTLSDLLYGEE